MKSPQISGVVFLKSYMKKLKNLSGVIWWGSPGFHNVNPPPTMWTRPYCGHPSTSWSPSTSWTNVQIVKIHIVEFRPHRGNFLGRDPSSEFSQYGQKSIYWKLSQFENYFKISVFGMPYATQNISVYRHTFIRFQNSVNHSTINHPIERLRWKLFTLKKGQIAQIERSRVDAGHYAGFGFRPEKAIYGDLRAYDFDQNQAKIDLITAPENGSFCPRENRHENSKWSK